MLVWGTLWANSQKWERRCSYVGLGYTMGKQSNVGSSLVIHSCTRLSGPAGARTFPRPAAAAAAPADDEQTHHERGRLLALAAAVDAAAAPPDDAT